MKSMALLEIGHFAPALVVADRCVKQANVRLAGLENTDAGTICLKFFGSTSDVKSATETAREIAARMKTSFLAAVSPAPEAEVVALVTAPPTYSPLVEQYDGWASKEGAKEMAINAIGLLETQGLVVNLHATDAMLKASSVTVLGKEKLGGGYITIMIEGDLAAVQAAIEAGKQTVESLGGKLILADVISNPHPELASLLPK